MNYLNFIRGALIGLIIVGGVCLLMMMRPNEIPADYCEKVHHISHQDYLDCCRAVKGMRDAKAD